VTGRLAYGWWGVWNAVAGEDLKLQYAHGLSTATVGIAQMFSSRSS
jgi:hypothetical protein